MNIYKVLPTGDQIGFIEIVDDSYTNAKVHENYGTGLFPALDEKSTDAYLHDKK